MNKQIKLDILVEFQYLDQNIKKYILSKAQNILYGKCMKDHGYILDIHKLISFESNHIASLDSSIIFHTVLEVSVLKPEIGSIYTGKVFLVSDCGGVLLTVQNVLKVLIPKSCLETYKYNNNRFEKGKKIIEKDCEVHVRVSNIRYENHTFSCIGEMV